MTLGAGIVASLLATANPQQPLPDRDTPSRDSVTEVVRTRPADARQQLSDIMARAARGPTRADSVLRVGDQYAAAFIDVWADSFPLRNLRWFRSLTFAQRRAKVAGDSVRLAGNRALGAAGTADAIRIWREAFRRAREIADTAGMAAAMGNIGFGFYRDWALDSARTSLDDARALANAVGDRRTSLNALRSLGSIALDRGEPAEARRMYQEALRDALAIGDVRGAAADHTNLGLIAAQLGDLDEARRRYQTSLEVARQHDLEDAAAVALLNFANAESEDAQYDQAARYYAEARRGFDALGDSASSALTRHNLGLMELRRGAYRDARAHLVEVLRLFDRIGTGEDQVQVRRDLASVDAAMGNLGAALTWLRSAQRLLRDLPDAHGLAAAVALAHADVAMHFNSLPEAEEQYGRAQSLYRTARDIGGELEAAEGHARLLIERRLFARAVEQLEGISRAQHVAGDRRSAALTRLAAAQAIREQRDFTLARRIAAESRDTLHHLGDAAGEAAARIVLGDIELQAGAPLTAATHYRAGIDRVREAGAPALEWQLHAGLARALRASGDVARSIQEFRAAAAHIERVAGTLALPERRAMFLSDKWDVYADLALTERARGDVAAAYDASERLRSRQMLDLLARGRIASRSAPDSALADRQQDVRARIRDLTLRLEAHETTSSNLRGPGLSPANAAATREALARAQQEYAQLLLELRGSGGVVGSFVHGEVGPWRVAADRLGPRQALLTYLVTDTASVVFVLTRDTIRVLDLDIDRRALATLIDFTRGTMLRADTTAARAAWRTPLRRLYRSLLGPVEAAGLLAGVDELTIVPHGELHYLPFAALIASAPDEPDEFLIQRYDIGYAASASAFVRIGARGSRPGDRILALAPRPEQLPGSRDEVEAIREVYGADATVLVGSNATERTLRTQASDFAIVHLATFGVLNQHNPLFSFVELNGDAVDDGRLEVHEVFGLSLNARLLVLSACQTALGSGAISDVPPGDDWVGLVRAFLGAGASNVIATLWAVEDRTTARLMETLHRRLRAGDSEVKALSAAQRQTLRNPDTAGPFYWAGFVLVGGPRSAP